MSVGDVVEIAAAGTAVLALISGAYSLEMTRRTSRATFWLQVRELFARHGDVHRRLRPGGQWASSNSGPSTAEEWAELEAYMGLLEHCEIMLRQDLIDLTTFKALYAYRVGNILANHRIVDAKLRREAPSWEAFAQLAKRLQLPTPTSTA